MTSPIKRISAREYAKANGMHEDTVQAWCRSEKLIARRAGRSWQIDVEASERRLSLKYGNAAEQELTKRNLR